MKDNLPAARRCALHRPGYAPTEQRLAGCVYDARLGGLLVERGFALGNITRLTNERATSVILGALDRMARSPGPGRRAVDPLGPRDAGADTGNDEPDRLDEALAAPAVSTVTFSPTS